MFIINRTRLTECIGTCGQPLPSPLKSCLIFAGLNNLICCCIRFLPVKITACKDSLWVLYVIFFILPVSLFSYCDLFNPLHLVLVFGVIVWCDTSPTQAQRGRSASAADPRPQPPLPIILLLPFLKPLSHFLCVLRPQ